MTKSSRSGPPWPGERWEQRLKAEYVGGMSRTRAMGMDEQKASVESRRNMFGLGTWEVPEEAGMQSVEGPSSSPLDRPML